MQKNGFSKASHKPKRINPAIKFAELSRAMRTNTVTPEILLRALKYHLSLAPTILFRQDAGAMRFGTGSVRGDKRDSSRARNRVEDGVTALEQLPGTMLHLIGTINSRPFNNDRLAEAEAFQSEVKALKKRLRRYAACKYVSVYEVQERGALHIHCLFKFVDRWFSWRKVMNAKGHYENRLRSRAEEARLAGLWTLGQAKVFVIEGETGGRYLSKYLSKGLNLSSLGALSSDPERLSEQKKLMMGIMFPIMAHLNRFDMSRGLAPLHTETREDRVRRASHAYQEDATPRVSADDLGKRLNNLTSACRGESFLLSNPIEKSEFDLDIGHTYPEEHPVVQDFIEKAQVCGCPGCMWSEIGQEWERKKRKKEVFTFDDVDRIIKSYLQAAEFSLEILQEIEINDIVRIYRQEREKEPENERLFLNLRPPSAGSVEKASGGRKPK
jgi:hypothetical protein